VDGSDHPVTKRADPVSPAERGLIADRVRDAVLALLLSGQQGTEVEVPELGEIITIERTPHE
jgi:hypothetical protein